MATIDTIAGVLESNLDIDPATVTPEATFESLGIDSLDMVELICDLEEACEVDFGEPRGSSPWATSSLTSTRCKPPAAFQQNWGPAAVRLRGLFVVWFPVSAPKEARLGSCRFAGGNVSEPRSIRAVALHFHKNRFRSAFPVMAASRFISSRSVGEGSCRCMRLTVMSV